MPEPVTALISSSSKGTGTHRLQPYSNRALASRDSRHAHIDISTLTFIRDSREPVVKLLPSSARPLLLDPNREKGDHVPMEEQNLPPPLLLSFPPKFCHHFVFRTWGARGAKRLLGICLYLIAFCYRYLIWGTNQFAHLLSVVSKQWISNRRV